MNADYVPTQMTSLFYSYRRDGDTGRTAIIDMDGMTFIFFKHEPT